MAMNAWIRASLTLVAAAAVGALLWTASQFDLHTTGGYWAAMGVIAGGGLLLGLAQRSAGAGTRSMWLVALVPVTVFGLWVIVVAQPHGNTFRHHLRSWDSDLGIGSAVHDLGQWNGVVALGIGLVLGLALAFVPLRPEIVETTALAPEQRAFAEPVTDRYEDETEVVPVGARRDYDETTSSAGSTAGARHANRSHT
jgi:hypothetical protein